MLLPFHLSPPTSRSVGLSFYLDQFSGGRPEGPAVRPDGGCGVFRDLLALLRLAPRSELPAHPTMISNLEEELDLERLKALTVARLKNPLSRRTVISSTPASRSWATRRSSHSVAPVAEVAGPGRQCTPTRSPVSAIAATSGRWLGRPGFLERYRVPLSIRSWMRRSRRLSS